MSVLMEQLLPNLDQWYTALQPFLNAKPNTALVMTNSLGGTLHLIDSLQESQNKDPTVTYDLEGYSLPIRIILYITNIMKLRPMPESVGEDQKGPILEMLSVFAELATDGLSIPSSRGLWKAGVEAESEMSDLLVDAQALFSANLQAHDYLAQELWHRSEGMSVASYYSARAYSTLMAQLAESSPSTTDAEPQRALPSYLDDDKLAFNAIASLTGAVDHKLALKLCNNYIDAIAEVDLDLKPLEGRTSLHALELSTNSTFSSISTYTLQLPCFISRRPHWKHPAASSRVPREASVHCIAQYDPQPIGGFES